MEFSCFMVKRLCADEFKRVVFCRSLFGINVVQINAVRALNEIFNDVVTGTLSGFLDRIEVKHVSAFIAKQGILTSTARQSIGSSATVQLIVAPKCENKISIVSADKR